MKQIENFIFNDIVLYSKGWYQRSSNICDDLGYLFYKIYGWLPTKESEIAHFMLVAIDKLYELKEVKFEAHRAEKCFASFHEEIDRRMKLYDVSYNMAIIYWAMNIFSQLSKNEIKLNCPHYGKKEHFRLGSMFGKYPISQTYKEMNKIAQKMFG